MGQRARTTSPKTKRARTNAPPSPTKREAAAGANRPRRPAGAATATADAQTAPDVIVDFLFDQGMLFVALQNIGDQPAYDVQVAFDQPFRGADRERDIGALRMFKHTPFLGPHREIRSFVDSSDAYFRRKEPTALTVKITFKSAAGAEVGRVIRHDLAIYQDIVILERGSPPRGDDNSQP